MAGLGTKTSSPMTYWVMEEGLENKEEMLSMHPNEDLAINAMLKRIDEYKEENPYATIVPTNNIYGSFTANGLVWWRIKRFLIV